MKKTLLFLSVLATVVFSGCKDDDSQPSFDEQLAIDEAIIEDYLEENNINAQKLESGISYVINVEGDGESPVKGDRIAVKYKSFSLTGTNLGMDTVGLTVDLDDQIITAWTLAVPEVREGGKMTMYAPSGYVFGVTGNGSIPPNEIVIFEVELIAIIGTEGKQFSVDEAIIDEFLSESDIDAEVHSSGIRYEVLEEGTGDSPDINSDVFVYYEGSLLTGQIFDGNDLGVLFNLQNLIEAWQIMLPTMKDGGGRIKFYAPSAYCYGPDGSATIPPNTILVFEIELVDVQ